MNKVNVGGWWLSREDGDVVLRNALRRVPGFNMIDEPVKVSHFHFVSGTRDWRPSIGFFFGESLTSTLAHSPSNGL